MTRYFAFFTYPIINNYYYYFFRYLPAACVVREVLFDAPPIENHSSSPNTWTSPETFLVVHRDLGSKKPFVYEYKLEKGGANIEQKKLFEAWWLSPSSLKKNPAAAGCLTASPASIYLIAECPVHGHYHHRILILSPSGTIKGVLGVPGKIMQLSVASDASTIIIAHRGHRLRRFLDEKTVYFLEGDDLLYFRCKFGDLWTQSLSPGAAALDTLHLTTFSEVSQELRPLGHPAFRVTVDLTNFSQMELGLPRKDFTDPQSIALAGTSKIFHQPGLHYLLLQNYNARPHIEPSRIGKVNIKK